MVCKGSMLDTQSRLVDKALCRGVRDVAEAWLVRSIVVPRIGSRNRPPQREFNPRKRTVVGFARLSVCKMGIRRRKWWSALGMKDFMR